MCGNPSFPWVCHHFPALQRTLQAVSLDQKSFLGSLYYRNHWVKCLGRVRLQMCVAWIVYMKKNTPLRQLPFLKLPGEKGRLRFDQSPTPLISITSPLLLGLNEETASATPLAEVSIASNSRASVIVVPVTHTHDPWKRVRWQPAAVRYHSILPIPLSKSTWCKASL